MTAYLVNAPDHDQSLIVYGKVALDSSGGGSACSQEGASIRCALTETDINLAGMVTGSPHFPVKQGGHIRPNPSNPSDKSSPDWFVHMASIEPDQSIGRVQGWKLIRGFVGAKFSFSSASVLVGELDGDEVKMPALIGFKGGGVRHQGLSRPLARALHSPLKSTHLRSRSSS